MVTLRGSAAGGGDAQPAVSRTSTTGKACRNPRAGIEKASMRMAGRPKTRGRAFCAVNNLPRPDGAGGRFALSRSPARGERLHRNQALGLESAWLRLAVDLEHDDLAVERLQLAAQRLFGGPRRLGR